MDVTLVQHMANVNTVLANLDKKIIAIEEKLVGVDRWDGIATESYVDHEVAELQSRIDMMQTEIDELRNEVDNIEIPTDIA